MERRSAVLWINLLGAGLTLSFFIMTPEASDLQPPRLIGCVFGVRSNVTCSWETGDLRATSYTLQVQKISRLTNRVLDTFTCNTSGSSCTTGISDLDMRCKICVSVFANIGNKNVSSTPRCQPGRSEAVFSAPILKKVEPVHGLPKCLKVSWSRDTSTFHVSDSEIKDGLLRTQIKFDAQEQRDVEENATITSDELYSYQVCFFKPDTRYSISLRSCFQGPTRSPCPWSQWSNSVEGRTAEDAPSEAPKLWREIKHTNGNGWKLVSLLWKPLPHFQANGQVVLYNVTCQTENTHVLSDLGSCKDLRYYNSSCSLFLPARRCFCNLTASNSVGTSPAAQIWISDSSETDLQPPSQFTVSPLDNITLEVNWTSPPNPSVSGFVVEWFAVREQSSHVLYWEKLNSSCTKLLITEGVKPMERYAVSVKALYREQGAGRNQTCYIYTREGTPSAAPNVSVQNIYSSSVEVSWRPPPVEDLHGFIHNYTIIYSTANQPAKRKFVPGNVLRYTLKNMLPGSYDIFMRVSTAVGTGPDGKRADVQIGSEDVLIYIYVLVPIIFTSLMLILVVFLTLMKMVKQKLFQSIPDPSNSTLSHWIPSTGFETMKLILTQEKTQISCSEVILLDQVKEMEDSSISQCLFIDLSYCPVHYDLYVPSKV